MLLSIHSTKFRFTNIYASNSPSKAYFQDLVSWLKNLSHHNHLVGGDFNSVVDSNEDRSSATSRYLKGLGVGGGAERSASDRWTTLGVEGTMIEQARAG